MHFKQPMPNSNQLSNCWHERKIDQAMKDKDATKNSHTGSDDEISRIKF